MSVTFDGRVCTLVEWIIKFKAWKKAQILWQEIKSLFHKHIFRIFINQFSCPSKGPFALLHHYMPFTEACDLVIFFCSLDKSNRMQRPLSQKSCQEYSLVWPIYWCNLHKHWTAYAGSITVGKWLLYTKLPSSFELLYSAASHKSPTLACCEENITAADYSIRITSTM